MGLSLAKMIDTPPVWLLGFAVLVWGLKAAIGSLPIPGFWALGTILVAAGLGLIGLAAFQFQKHKTTIIPHLEARSLITSGVFRYSRNPIYLADATILAGLCLRWEAAYLLVLVPLFCWVIQTRFIQGEEDRLRAGFGAEFEAYAAKTRRWL